MKFPKGRGFDLVCGVIVTVVLDDFISLTGTFLGEIPEKHHHRKCEEFHEFILIQLTSPICGKDGLEVPRGTICAINLDKIQFIFPGMKCQDKAEDKFDNAKCQVEKNDNCDDDKCQDKKDDKFNDDKGHDKWDDDKW